MTWRPRDPSTAGSGRSTDDDSQAAGCQWYREELSAALDGEADPARRQVVEQHLTTCPACARWHDAAARVTRVARTGLAETGPDLVGAVTTAADAALPSRRAARWRVLGPRLALALTGVVQIVLGVVALLGATGGPTGHDVSLGAGMVHLGHETAAWNLALGAAFVAGAWWTRHLRGLLPALGVFVLALGALSVVDLVAGRVEPARVLSHVVLIVAFVLCLLVSRAGAGPAPAHRPAVRRPRAPEDLSGGREAETAALGAPRLGPVAHDERRAEGA